MDTPLPFANRVRGALRSFSWRWVGLIVLALAVVNAWDLSKEYFYEGSKALSGRNLGLLLLMHTIVAICCASAVAIVRPWETKRPTLSLIFTIMIGSAIGLVVYYSLKYAVTGIAGPTNCDGCPPKSLPSALFLSWSNISIIALFVSFLFMLHIQQSQAKAARFEADKAREIAAKTEVAAQLKVLQAQVEPHFLFNTLAHVHYLIETSPREAARMLESLIAYLRAAVPRVRQDGATLGQEAELCRTYLAIIKMRLGERLAFDVEIDVALAKAPFPPLTLLTLVENAVRHGIEPSSEGGRIDVNVRRDGDTIHVEVRDTGVGVLPGAPEHVGLRNIRERLRALYGDRASLMLRTLSPHGTRAELTLPISA